MKRYLAKNILRYRPQGLSLKGFTLIEMLIALSIGAAIALLAYQALSGAINIEERVTEQSKSLEGISLTWQLLGDDLHHAVPRTWSPSLGSQQPSMVGALGDRQAQSSNIATGNDSYLLQLVRAGEINVFKQSRSNLVGVGYRLTIEEDENDEQPADDEGSGNLSLWRDYWRPIDSVEEPTISSRRVLDNIISVQFRYLPHTVDGTKDENWINGWPPPATATNSLPIAVEVDIELEDIGRVVRLFRLVEAES